MDPYFSEQPFGFRFGTRRLTDAPGWDGPRDDDGCQECGGRTAHDPACPEREER